MTPFSPFALIGGEHWLAPGWDRRRPRQSLQGYLDGLFPGWALFASGRDALAGCVEQTGTSVWLPDFACHALYRPVEAAGRLAGSYPIDGMLRAKLGSWTVGAGDTVVVVNFFGMVDRPLYAALARKRAVILSDVTHLLWNPAELAWVRDRSDLVFASLRKIGPLPDAGMAAGKTSGAPRPSGPPRVDVAKLRFRGLVERGAAHESGCTRESELALFAAAEEQLDGARLYGAAASEMNAGILARLNARRGEQAVSRNGGWLQRAWAGVPQPEALLPPGVVSPYFPVVFADRSGRDRVREALRHEGIICPIHWETSFLKPAHPLSERILSLPCDGRYSPAVLKKAAGRLMALAGDLS